MMPSGPPQPRVFELYDPTLAETAPEVLGLWAAVPAAAATVPAFSTTAAQTSPFPIWRVNLPGESPESLALLARGETRLATSQRALQSVTGRFHTLLALQPAVVAFDTRPTFQTLAPPEAELYAALRALTGGQAPVSFALGERLLGGWGQALRQLPTVIERLQQSVAHYIWVETRIQEQLIGRTAVSWTGDCTTVWPVVSTPQQQHVHQCALTLALQSRATLLRTFIMATRFALQLAVRLSLPGGVLLAMPAAWQFIQQVLAEYHQPDARAQEEPHG